MQRSCRYTPEWFNLEITDALLASSLTINDMEWRMYQEWAVNCLFEINTQSLLAGCLDYDHQCGLLAIINHNAMSMPSRALHPHGRSVWVPLAAHRAVCMHTWKLASAWSPHSVTAPCTLHVRCSERVPAHAVDSHCDTTVETIGISCLIRHCE